MQNLANYNSPFKEGILNLANNNYNNNYKMFYFSDEDNVGDTILKYEQIIQFK